MKTLLLCTALISSLANAALTTSYVIIADSGKDNKGQADVAKAMKRHCEQERCDYGMLAGDIIYPGGMTKRNDPAMKRYFHKHYDQLNIPFLIALGNHDYGKVPLNWERGDFALHHAMFQANFILPHYYYLKITKNAIIAVLDTNRLFFFKDEKRMVNLLKGAYKLAKQLNMWFVVMGHHPYLSNGKHGNAGSYEGIPGLGYNIKNILNDHMCGKADFYIAGHEHLLQAFDGNVADCDTQMIVSGTAAKATEILRDTPSLFETESLGFFHLELSGDTATVKAIDEFNTVLYQQTHKKKLKGPILK
ncbi:MAG: metallophosphoesterase [Bacteriovoracaceae bacterium]|nr:metallophosphoesterase [Bacteriovoracaceae bacterium]